jgi:hypothetical protein
VPRKSILSRCEEALTSDDKATVCEVLTIPLPRHCEPRAPEELNSSAHMSDEMPGDPHRMRAGELRHTALTVSVLVPMCVDGCSASVLEPRADPHSTTERPQHSSCSRMSLVERSKESASFMPIGSGSEPSPSRVPVVRARSRIVEKPGEADSPEERDLDRKVHAHHPLAVEIDVRKDPGFRKLNGMHRTATGTTEGRDANADVFRKRPRETDVELMRCLREQGMSGISRIVSQEEADARAAS